MIDTLGARDRRTLLIGTAMVVSVLAIGRGAPAWRRWDAAARARAEYATAELDRAREVLSAEPEVSERRGAAEQSLIRTRAMFLEGRSPEEAQVVLSRTVSELAAETGVRIHSLHATRDTTTNSRAIPLHLTITATADIVGIARFLAGIEADDPVLVVRGLSVTQNAPAAGDLDPEVLQVEMSVAGLWLVGGGST